MVCMLMCKHTNAGRRIEVSEMPSSYKPPENRQRGNKSIAASTKKNAPEGAPLYYWIPKSPHGALVCNEL